MLLPLAPTLPTNSIRNISDWISSTQNYRINTENTSNDIDSTILPNPYYEDALQLLRQDVIELCVGIGIPPKDLYPKEAILLNLILIHQYCNTMVKRCNIAPILYQLSNAYNAPTFFNEDQESHLFRYVSEASLINLFHRYQHKKSI